MTLEEWIGKNAFGLGCELATILKRDADIEVELREIFTAIRNWYEGKIEIEK